MSEISNRYEKLGFRKYQFEAHYYPFICKELSVILRRAYSKLPKNLQIVLFQDTLAAFLFLPQVEMRSGMEAAKKLLQAAEVALPKHKRALAVTEFKHAVVAYKRHHKAQKDVKASAQLPEDVLVHVFGFLDICSLVAVSSVCWSWNSASHDNKLWHSLYEVFFGSSTSGSKGTGQMSGTSQKSNSFLNKRDGTDHTPIDWREHFKQTYIGNSSQRFTSNRGYCSICKSVVWLSNMKCPNVHHGVKVANQQINPVSPQQIVEYLLRDSYFAYSSSDSDSDDSDERSSLKLWAFAKHI